MYYTLKIDNPSKVFFTSDSHFTHFNVARLCNRPYSSRSEMNQGLINNWNNVVPEDGVVIHCGDFMLPHKIGYKEYSKYINKLNGTIYLTRGNHDKIDLGNYDDKLIVNDCMYIQVEKTLIYAQHYPCLAFNGDIQVFGHIHTLSDGKVHGLDSDVPDKLKFNQYDVGVDQNNYTPINYNQLINIINERQFIIDKAPKLK
jgi:predicted phosphoesterase or phosphohydrolase|nr:MAG TPA: metallophosphatase domain protein [Crassvirales sp.]